MATLKTGTTIGGNIAWHAGNDGPGSGLDADTVDGLQDTQLRATISATAPSSPRVGQMWVNTADTHLYDSDWIVPTLINGWANYNPGWSQARFSKAIGGYVTIEGLIMNGTNGAAAFVLPVGYRPLYVEIMPSQHDPNTASIVQVYDNGNVVPYWTNGGTNAWASIHCTFYVEQ